MAHVADEYRDRLARGDGPDSGDYARRYPELAGLLPDVFPALRLIHGLAPTGDAPASSPTGSGTIGEFRLIRELGRGGMGVVFEAEQSSLGRRVALKVLPFASGSSRPLARFRVESQAAAMLRHPHIVPVFASGCDRGIHYYAMQLIEGRSLAEVLRDPERRGRGLHAREAAELARQAAEALDYAHELGVLHRDVKPGNLLVDVRGHLWVADFGLARVPGMGDLTLTGDVLGTLRYMSPEQATGARAVDPRADVYGLGATLYELIRGRPAFDAADRRELLRQIALDDPMPLRRGQPEVPRALETIVLKAMAKEPEHRYSSARALADDLGRFLRDEPIQARRPGPLEQAGRLARRHKGLVGAGLVGLTVITLVSAGTAGLLWAERAKTHKALEDAQVARQRERDALRFTFKASDQIADVGLRNLLRPGPVEGEEASFCRSALNYYTGISGRFLDDPDMVDMAAAIEHRIGFLRLVLREPASEAAFKKSIALYERLIAQRPHDRQLRSSLIFVLRDMAYMYQDRGDLAAALACAQRRLDELRRASDTIDAFRYLVYDQFSYVRLLAKAGRQHEAEEARGQLQRDLTDLIERLPGDALPLNNLAWLIVSFPEAPSPDEARRAVELSEQAVALDGTKAAYWNTLGVARYRTGQLQGALAAFQESMRLNEGGDAYDWLFMSMIHERLGQFEEARKWYDKARDWVPPNPDRALELTQFRQEAALVLGLDAPTDS
jgi:serine/threonine protein kinase